MSNIHMLTERETENDRTWRRIKERSKRGEKEKTKSSGRKEESFIASFSRREAEGEELGDQMEAQGQPIRREDGTVGAGSLSGRAVSRSYQQRAL